MCDSIQSGIQHGIQIRWMIRRDMPQVLRIERESFAVPWTDADFLRELRDRNVIGLVAATAADRVLGFMVYRAAKTHYVVRNLAIAREFRRQGIGSAMIGRLTSKLSPDRRRQVITMVEEANLDAQLFFRACGGRCEEIAAQPWDGSDLDGYVFRFRVREPEGAAT